jgi:Zn-dependent peptidase ImmA (M78 family)
MKSDLQLNGEAIKQRELLGYSYREPIDLESSILKRENVTLVKVKMSNHMSGMCIKDDGSWLIGINSSMSLGRQRFTEAHEWYHLAVEENCGGRICNSDLYDEKSESEKEANIFASYLLMPYEGLDWYMHQFAVTDWKPQQIIRLSQYYKISYMACLFRLRHEKKISAPEYEKLKLVNVIEVARDDGQDISLYMKSLDLENEVVLGEYIRLLQESKNAFPESIYRQYLREGVWDEENYKKMIGGCYEYD